MKITQEEEIKPTDNIKNTFQGNLYFHPDQHIPLLLPHAHAFPKPTPRHLVFCLFSQCVMPSSQQRPCPSQLPAPPWQERLSLRSQQRLHSVPSWFPAGGSTSTATSAHSQFPAIPPKGLCKAMPSCWGSRRAKAGPAPPLIPSYTREKPPAAPNR